MSQAWKFRAVFFSAPAVGVATVAMGTVSLICSLWDRKGVAQHNVARAWSRMLLRLSFVRCRVYGIEKLDVRRSYVLVANHASFSDTPAILSAVPLQFRFFAKSELFSIPFLGWHLRRAGHLPVVRDDPRASVKSMSEGAKLMARDGFSLLLFPEGGRSEEHMQPFKEGAAFIAIKGGIPVVPIGLVNTRKVLPMHSWLIHPATIELHVGDPIETAGMKLHDRARLNEMLQDRVAELAGETAVYS